MSFRPELYAIEILFLELQLLSLTDERRPKDFILKFDPIVHQLADAAESRLILASFKQYLAEDWEFGFMLNYLVPDFTTKMLLERTPKLIA
jgi:hypothetical protein